jgi:hypothetical protein
VFPLKPHPLGQYLNLGKKTITRRNFIWLEHFKFWTYENQLNPTRNDLQIISKYENILYTNPDYLFQLLWFLKYHTKTRFQVLINICEVDHPSQKWRFEVIYNLLRATAKSLNKMLICAKQMRCCRSLQQDGHDLMVENVAYRRVINYWLVKVSIYFLETIDNK